MNISRKFFPMALVAVSMLGFTSCNEDNDDDPVMMNPQVSIADFVAANPDDYSSLLAALQKAGLVDAVSDANANLTVFAPNNAAFSAFLESAGATLESIDSSALRQVLLNHVIGQELKADAVISTAPGYVSNLASGPNNLAGAATNLSTFYALEGGNVLVNGDVTVTTPNAYDASNGVIHAVDKVIGLPNISTFAIADARISTLKDVLVQSDLVATVDGIGTATVFAPTNEAFASLAAVPSGDALASVLTYHVIANVNVVASDLPALAGTNSPATVQGETIGILADAEFKGNGNSDNVKVVIADIQAANGVVHVIDGVLLPNP